MGFFQRDSQRSVNNDDRNRNVKSRDTQYPTPKSYNAPKGSKGSEKN